MDQEVRAFYRVDAAVRAARLVERDPALIAASGPLLAVARA